MEPRDRNSLLFPLILLLGMMFPVAITMRQPTAPQGAPKEQAEARSETGTQTSGSQHKRAQRVVELVERFLGVDLDKDKWQSFSADSYRLDFVIATVPDPITSPLPYLFDSSLESIRRAARAADFVLDRSYLPWHSNRQGSAEARGGRSWYTEPGVLLFRRRRNNAGLNDAKPASTAPATKPAKIDLLAVLLVGETPTAGIHKGAFAKALQEMAEARSLEGIQGIQVASVCSNIRILGPSFTGSAVSLRLALEKWLKSLPPKCEKRVNVKVLSGTATAISPGTLDRKDDSQDEKKAVPKKISFQSMAPYDPDFFRSIWKYLAALHYCKVALLAEDSTLYGKTGKEKLNCKGKKMEFTYLTFPLYIAQLRREADLERKAMQQPPTAATDSRAFLPMPEEEERRGRGAPHSFSTFSVTYAELNLSNLLTTLSREGIRAVGILATDVRDTIFLAREIRNRAPDMLIFAFNSDLLYTHPEANTAAYGMLVFTPYPLINANQLWSYPYRGRAWRLQFSSQFAQGIYNAAIVLLDEQKKAQETQQQEQQKKPQNGQDSAEEPLQESLVEYGRPFEGKCPAEYVFKPALWVTMVGHNTLMPVTILPCPAKPDTYMHPVKGAGSAANTELGIYSSAVGFGMVAVGLMLLAFSGIVTYVYWPTRRENSGKDRGHWLAWRFGDPVCCSYRASSRFYLLVCCGVLLVSYAFSVFLYTLPSVAAGLDIHLSTPQAFLLFPLLRAAVLALLIATLVMLIAALDTWRGRARQRDSEPGKNVKRAVQVLVFAGAAFAVFLLTRLIWHWWDDAGKAPFDAVFDHLRAFNWPAGVSPLLPECLIALAALLWGLAGFSRLRMIDGIRPENLEGRKENARGHEVCMFLKLDQDCCKGLAPLESRIKDLFEQWSVLSSMWQVGLLLAGAALAFYFFKHRFLHTVEGGEYDWLFAMTYFFVYGVLAVECGRLFLLWRELRRFLKRLAQLPLRAAFARYHRKHPSLTKISFATPPPTFTVLEFSVEEASELVRMADKKDEHLAKWLKEAGPATEQAQEALAKAHESDAGKSRRASLEGRRKAQCALSDIVPPLGAVMNRYWSTKMPEQEPVKEGQEPVTFYTVAEEFLAGRAVHFISYVLPAIRNLSAFALAGLLLMLLAVVSYPFQPEEDFLLFNWIVILAFIGTALTIVVQMERDFVMSSLNGSEPGKVSFSFGLVFRFLAYGAIPIMALLGAQFPDALRKVLSVFSTQNAP